jgi:hypothetical protein
MIIDGELDHLPESAFNLKGTMKKLLKQEKNVGRSLKNSLSLSLSSYVALNFKH